jgi:hypothetical protein
MHGIRPDQILVYAKRAIDAIVRRNKGAVSIAKDPWNVLELLAESPAGFRCILHWAGDKLLGDQEELPLLTSRLEVILSYNLGLTATAESALVEKSPLTDRPSLLRLVAIVRERVLQKLWPADFTEEQIRYVGTDPVGTPEGIPLAAYRLVFELDHAGPEFTNEDATLVE